MGPLIIRRLLVSLPALIAAGAFMTARVNKAPLVLVFLGVYYLVFTIAAFTGDPAQAGWFRPPSLRNVAVTAPYMHDGSVATLEEVIDLYAAGGRGAGAFAARRRARLVMQAGHAATLAFGIGAAQGIDMPFSRQKHPFPAALPPHMRQQCGAECRQALAGFGRQSNPCFPRVFDLPCRQVGKVNFVIHNKTRQMRRELRQNRMVGGRQALARIQQQ